MHRTECRAHIAEGTGPGHRGIVEEKRSKGKNRRGEAGREGKRAGIEYHFSTVLLAFVCPPLVILFLDALWGNTSQLHSLVQYLQNI